MTGKYVVASSKANFRSHFLSGLVSSQVMEERVFIK